MQRLVALILGAGMLFLYSSSYAQSFRYAEEALLFSQYSINGTARSIGVGNAQTAIGADLGSVYMNPAGVGLFNRSEFSFTPTIRYTSNDATYQGNTSFNNKVNLAIRNLGAVISWREKDKTEGFLGGSLAISYSQLANYNNRYNYQRSVCQNGRIDDLADIYANGRSSDIAELAFDSYLLGDYYLFDNDGNKVYVNTPAFSPSIDAPAIQMESIKESGSLSNFSVAYGANIADKYYIGGGLNILGINYNKNILFRESYLPSDEVTDIEVIEKKAVTGGGVNLSLGLIARPIEALRVGIGYQTPSFISLEETYITDFAAYYNNFTVNSGASNSLYLDDILEPYTFNGKTVSDNGPFTNIFEYQLKTPGRLNLGAAYFIGKAGFVSADVEFLNYRNARLTDDLSSLDEDNLAIKTDYTNAVNYRLGTEWRVDILRLRGGYAFQGDPYKMQDGLDRFSKTFTLGAGLKYKYLYADIAFLNTMNDEYRAAYSYEQALDYAKIQRTTNAMVFTLGLNL